MYYSRKLRRTFRRLADTIREVLLRSRNGEYVLIYQMGKVGSSSIYASLRGMGIPGVYHSHRMNPDNISRIRAEHRRLGIPAPPGDALGLRLYRKVICSQAHVRVICPVRDPISRNMSAFFQNQLRYWGEHLRTTWEDREVAPLIEQFLNEYDHDVPLTWMDLELKQTLGIDVYAHPFPRETGILEIESGVRRLLLFKCEIDDKAKEDALRRFIDLPSFVLRNQNVSRSKRYAETYAAFRSAVHLPPAYIERICESRFTKHFYTEDEIRKMRDKWK